MFNRDDKIMGTILVLLAVIAIVAVLIDKKYGFGENHDIADDKQTSESSERISMKGNLQTGPLSLDQSRMHSDVRNPLSAAFHPTGLTIARDGKLQNAKTAPPASYQVTDAGLAERIYASLLTLKPVPKGEIFHCPIDYGISYEMDFSASKHKTLHLNANAAGCQFVRLDDGAVLREDDTFRQAMMDATGMDERQLGGEPGAF